MNARSLPFALLCVLVGATTLALLAGCQGREETPPAETHGETASEPAATEAPGPTEVPADAEVVTTESGLKYVDLVVGSGASPEPGQIAVVHYTGWLTDGTKFDSSRDRGQPFTFPVARGRVIKGWDEGVASMNVGGKRKLMLPPDLGYGEEGAGGGLIPPNAELVFEVELLDIR
jgi:peptidylprolyl isomerase